MLRRWSTRCSIYEVHHRIAGATANFHQKYLILADSAEWKAPALDQDAALHLFIIPFFTGSCLSILSLTVAGMKWPTGFKETLKFCKQSVNEARKPATTTTSAQKRLHGGIVCCRCDGGRVLLAYRDHFMSHCSPLNVVLVRFVEKIRIGWPTSFWHLVSHGGGNRIYEMGRTRTRTRTRTNTHVSLSKDSS